MPAMDILSDDYVAPPEQTEDGLIRTEIPILGMTCRSCEMRVGRFLSRIRDIEHVEVSAPRHRAIVESTRPLSYRAVEKAIRQAGYEIGETPWLERDPKIWLTAGAGVVLVVLLALLIEVTGVARLTAGVGDLSQGGIVVALLLGLAAGVSTCIALVGGLVLALSASFQASTTTPRTGIAAMRPAFVFLGGRVVGYAFFGMLLGALGASIKMPVLLTAVLMVAVGIVMTILGTRLTGLSPRVAGWSPTLPMGLGKSLGASGGGSGAYSDRRAATLGAASFFLPCGFTQAVQIFALSTGSPVFGAALLGTFALGTGPGLLALAGVPVMVPSGARPTLLRLVGVVVLAFAFLNANAGLQLIGINLPGLGAGLASAATPSTTLTSDGKQLLTTYQDADGYRPGNVAIWAGIPTVWTVQSRTGTSCAAILVIPAWDTGAQLRTGPNVFNLPALPPGVVRYTCGMGMYSAYITIVERPATPSPGPSPSASQGTP